MFYSEPFKLFKKILSSVIIGWEFLPRNYYMPHAMAQLPPVKPTCASIKIFYQSPQFFIQLNHFFLYNWTWQPRSLTPFLAEPNPYCIVHKFELRFLQHVLFFNASSVSTVVQYVSRSLQFFFQSLTVVTPTPHLEANLTTDSPWSKRCRSPSFCWSETQNKLTYKLTQYLGQHTAQSL